MSGVVCRGVRECGVNALVEEYLHYRCSDLDGHKQLCAVLPHLQLPCARRNAVLPVHGLGSGNEYLAIAHYYAFNIHLNAAADRTLDAC